MTRSTPTDSDSPRSNHQRAAGSDRSNPDRTQLPLVLDAGAVHRHTGSSHLAGPGGVHGPSTVRESLSETRASCGNRWPVPQMLTTLVRVLHRGRHSFEGERTLHEDHGPEASAFPPPGAHGTRGRRGRGGDPEVADESGEAVVRDAPVDRQALLRSCRSGRSVRRRQVPSRPVPTSLSQPHTDARIWVAEWSEKGSRGVSRRARAARSPCKSATDRRGVEPLTSAVQRRRSPN